MASSRSFRRLLRVRLSPAQQAELDIADELRLHLDLRTEELMNEGMSEDNARREAQRAFGDVERAHQELLAPARRQQHRVRAGEWIGDIVRDVRYGARSLWRAPAFAAVTVLTLALGIGATTAMFSIVDAVLLEPLPFEEPDELAMIFEARVDEPDDHNVVNPGNYLDWKARSRSFASMAALYQFPVTLLSGSAPREITVQLADAEFFRTLGVQPLVGRLFTPEEAAVEPGAGQVVILSENFWREELGGDPNVVGTTLDLVGQRVEVIGVMPAEVHVVAGETAFWSPSDYSWGTRGGRFITVIGRMADGVTLDAAERELQAIAADLREAYPEFNARWTTNVVPLTEHLSGDVRVMMLVVLGAVAVLLLIACVNVANLLLARAATRRTEIAVRSSLGAGRGRIARGLMLESMVLALCGGAVGVALAYVATRALVAGVPDSLRIARLDEVSVDPGVLGFALLVTVITGLLFGIAPVAEAFRTNLASAVREGGRGSGGARRARRTRAVLVVVQVAMSLVLLTGAGLLLRSLLELQRTDLGFNPEQVVTSRLTMRGERYTEGAARVAFLDQAIASIAALPSVHSAGMIWWLPLSGAWSATDYYLPDQPRPAPGEEPGTQVQAVQGDVFNALGIPLLQGRTFDSRDQAGGAEVVIVNRAFAEAAWPGQNPIGRRVVLPWGYDRDLEVVGVVGDIRHKGADQLGEPGMFLPHAQFTEFASAHMIVRTAGAAPGAQREIVERIHAIDPNLAVADVKLMRDVFADSVARPRLTSMLVAVFALLAVLLAAVGIYGVVSYTVTLRAREMGVRRALGAQTGDVASMVLRDALRLGGAGIAIGIVVALMTTRVLESLLYGVRAEDPVVLVGTSGLLLAVTVVAALVPAWRASRVSPTEAIRYE